jgi:hypothetical protein
MAGSIHSGSKTPALSQQPRMNAVCAKASGPLAAMSRRGLR